MRNLHNNGGYGASYSGLRVSVGILQAIVLLIIAAIVCAVSSVPLIPFVIVCVMAVLVGGILGLFRPEWTLTPIAWIFRLK